MTEIKKENGLQCKISEFVRSKLGYALVGALIGAFFFIIIYGPATLLPTNVSFLYYSNDKDTVSHQMGFEFYRRSPWRHPLGLTNFYPYPYESSVINSDSLPIIAIPLKLISSFLPQDFQFFGIWILFCFIMQGLAAALLLRKLKVDFSISVASIPFFVINVPLLFRCFHHSSLAGQWLILFCFLLILESESLSLKKQVLYWCILCGLSVWIHGYLFVMVGLLMTMYLIYHVIKKGTVKDSAIIFFSCVVTTLLFYYEGGGYISNTSVMMRGLGVYSLDLTDYFNPVYFSSFFSGMESGTTSETASYCGLGIMVILIIALVVLCKYRDLFKSRIRSNRMDSYFIIGYSIVFICLAMGVSGRFAGVSLYDMRPLLSRDIAIFLSEFRASARFIWPVWYLVLILAICIINIWEKHRKVLVSVLLICVVLQYFDIVPKTAKNGAEGYINGLDTRCGEAFDNVFTDEAEHLCFLGASYNIDYAIFAAHNGMTSNFSTVGRGPKNAVQKDTDEFNAGIIREDTVYVLNIDSLNYIYPLSSLSDDCCVYLYDDFLIFFKDNLMQELPSPDAIPVDKQKLAEAVEQVYESKGEPEPVPTFEGW